MGRGTERLDSSFFLVRSTVDVYTVQRYTCVPMGNDLVSLPKNEEVREVGGQPHILAYRDPPTTRITKTEK